MISNRPNNTHYSQKWLLVATLSTLLITTGCGRSEDEKVSNGLSSQTPNLSDSTQGVGADEPYAIETVLESINQADVALGGSVVPKYELTIRAQAPGRVVYIAGEEGTTVRRGEPIVDLDEKSLLAKRRAAVAGLHRARADLNNAYIQLDHNIISDGYTSSGGMGMPSMFDQFFTNNFSDAMGVGDSDYDRYASISASRAVVENSKSAVLEAESNIDQIDAMFRDKQAIAPLNAIILNKMIELGDAVQPGQALLRIGDISELQVVVDVPARIINGLKEGMTLTVNLDTHDEMLEATIIRIFPSADIKRNTVRIKLALPANINATPGMYATVSVPDSNRESISTISVPSSAIVWRGSQASLFVVNANGKAELRIVRIGNASAERTAILSGLSKGERVVTTPDTHLRSGMTIQAAPTSAPANAFTKPKTIIPDLSSVLS